VLRVLVGYLLLVNVLTVLVYWSDKRRAQAGRRRITERELLFWALAGGSPGALWAMRRFRHKTSKFSFKAAFVGVILVQAVALWLLFSRGR